MLRRYILPCAAMVILSLAVLFLGSRMRPAPSPLPVSNEDAIIEGIRHGLREHSSCITIRFSCQEDVMGDLTETVRGWIEAALSETDNPAEGDYIRYQYGGYTMDCAMEPSGSLNSYRVEIRPRYYLYLMQEEQVAEALSQVYEALDLDSDAPDIHKLRAIYGYVCENVRYDQVHKKNEYFHTKSTAYSALIQHTATCQGYAVLLYRMLRENGISCRVVTGRASGPMGTEYHAWNIAEADGQYYCLDATWDAGKPADQWTCFLKGTDSFTDHEPDPQFLTADFLSRYPPAWEDAREP